MSLSPQQIIEKPCEEVIPTKPFPFKSNRISRSFKFFHYLIFFPFYVEYKKCKRLYTFNLETLEWSSVELRKSPEILEITDNYAILPYLEDQFVLFGCYKTFAAARTNNLFSQVQQATTNSVLSFIETKFTEGQLTLEWKPSSITDLPYLEKFSADSVRYKIFLFGGYDESGKVSNELWRIDLDLTKVASIELVNEEDGQSILPARANHGSYFVERDLLIFGGEDQDSHELNDMWMIILPRNLEAKTLECVKLHKQTISRRPKLGTRAVCFNECLFYIGKSSSEVIAPIRNYLCIEEFYVEPKHQTQTYSPKKHLPFDVVPHTLEIVKDKLILGYGSSLYTISIQEKNAAWSVDDNFGIKTFDSDDVSLVKKRQEAKSFKDHMRKYFDERPHPDIMFNVQGEEVSAHKGILSVRSRHFYTLFTNEAKDKDLKNPIEIEDLSPAAFNTLLEWFYCNSILEMKDEVAIELFKAAEKYEVPELKEEAKKSLVKNVILQNLIADPQLAIEFNAKDLESAAVKLVPKVIDSLKEREQLDLLPSSVIERALKFGK